MEIRLSVEEYGTLEVGEYKSLHFDITPPRPGARIKMVDAIEEEDAFEFILSPEELNDFIKALVLIQRGF